jgi:hypothetical protein
MLPTVCRGHAREKKRERLFGEEEEEEIEYYDGNDFSVLRVG